MDEEKNESQSKISSWIKDNLRIIVSVAVVIAIAGGIYSYSKRTQTDLISEEPETQKITEKSENEQEKVEIESQTPESDKDKKSETQKTTEAEKASTSSKKQEVTSAETGAAFVETAVRGDGVTHLARRALANYLEKNPDSTLTPDHKIYIEDYLRKHVGHKGRVFVGTTISFEKDLIKQAIEQSKKLNERQLKNLEKYSARVPSLT